MTKRNPEKIYRDIIVVGASAGGVEALQKLVRALPSELPASVFAVIHFPSTSRSYLPLILSRAGKLPAVHPVDAEPLQPGKIYIAPPDQHMILRDHTIQLVYGPREHGFRPAVDPLFRSAAQAFGERVVGVVLSGTMDDGSAGLIAIKTYGGLSIAQDPDEALYSGMPLSAIENDHVDWVLSISDIAAKLVHLATVPLVEKGVNPASKDLEMEFEIVEKDVQSFEAGESQPKNRTTMVCPECGGVLWELREGELMRYRCHVGHAYSDESLLESKNGVLESALWTAVRALEERAMLARRLAVQASKKGYSNTAKRFRIQAEDAEQNADIVRRLLLEKGRLNEAKELISSEEQEMQQVTDQPLQDEAPG